MTTIRPVTSRSELEQCWQVRWAVFVREQGVPPEEEVDEADSATSTQHVLARDAEGRPVGTGRLLVEPEHPDEPHLGRLAVLSQARGTGLGARLVVALEGLALAEHGAVVEGPGPVRLTTTVVLSAQEQAIGFYERLGYRLRGGERYLDAGIWHREMAHPITR